MRKKELAVIEFIRGVKNIDDIYGLSANDFILLTFSNPFSRT